MAKTTQITRANQRGHTDISWLDSRHSFSFGSFYDPSRMGFGPLRVVNEDRVAPSGGFPPHPHSDMEIISIVLDGQLEHKDSMGNGRVIETGDIQYMSAGTGVTHSEFNPSAEKPVHFMQIWVEPNAKGLAPRYADQALVGAENNVWSLVFSPDGRDGSMAIRQDVELRTVQLDPEASIQYRSEETGRGFWIFVIEGSVEVDGAPLHSGDSLALSESDAVTLRSVGEAAAKVMLFDVAL
ncbi:MAG: pirin family protein [Verrucomicrobiota bacterium]